MLKILYAAGNNSNGKIALARFIKAMQGKPFTIKVAAYKKSSPNINIDWTLDCLLNIFRPEHISLDNQNLDTYFKQIKYYAPDLIISDMEYFTSHIANELDITLWQCSSSLINFALTTKQKYSLGIFKHHAYLLNKNPLNTQRHIHVLDNSNGNFIYSHFGDSQLPPEIKPEYEWIRPYHHVGKISVPCQHNIVAGMLNSNKNILRLLKQYTDSVVFTGFTEEQYPNLLMKDINNEEEYFCNIKNSNLFANEGQTSFLADAFYNGKYSIVIPNTEDPECMINSTISEKLMLSTSIYQSEDLNPYINLSIPVNYNKHIKYLHEKVEEL